MDFQLCQNFNYNHLFKFMFQMYTIVRCNEQIFSLLYHLQNKLHFNEVMMMKYVLYFFLY